MKRRQAKKIVTISRLRYFPEKARYRCAVKRITQLVKGRLWVLDGSGPGGRDKDGIYNDRILVYTADNTGMGPFRRKLPV